MGLESRGKNRNCLLSITPSDLLGGFVHLSPGAVTLEVLVSQLPSGDIVRVSINIKQCLPPGHFG